MQRGPEMGQLRAKGRMRQERTGTDGAWEWGVRPTQADRLGAGWFGQEVQGVKLAWRI